MFQCQVIVSLLPVSNLVLTVENSVCPGAYPVMLQARSFRVDIHGDSLTDLLNENAVSLWALLKK